MKRPIRFWFTTALLGLCCTGWLSSELVLPSVTTAAESTEEAVPVESDMHEFMEYVFQPTFKRLKPAMAAAPTDNQGWKTIKADGLVLAESANLLLVRKPGNDDADWVKHSVQVRTFGGQLYRSAKAKDFAAARKQYEAMIQNCNACHHQFAGGEHILTP